MFIEQVKRVEWVDYAMLEMSIIPIPHEWKRPEYAWKRVQWSKLHVLMNDAKGQRMLEKMFDLSDGGLAVVCGYPSENLLVIDCDTHDALIRCKQQLIARGIDAPCVLSSRGGHLYLRCREGGVQTVAAGILCEMEIRGDGAIAVLPPTRHKSGVVYRWEHGHPPRNIPTISIDEIDFLTGVDGQPIKLVLSDKRERRLCDATREYLRCGYQLGEGTRNNRLFYAAMDYKFVGESSNTALFELLPIAIASGLSEKEATATILSPFSNAKVDNSVRAYNQTDYLEAFASRVKWSAHTRKTDSSVFAALIQRRKAEAYNRQDGVFRASLRELMVLARVNSPKTVSNSLTRMKAAGYIQHMGHDARSHAALYRMSDMVLGAGKFFLMHDLHTTQQLSVLRTYCGNHAHLLTESVAMGHTAMNILNFLRLQNLPMTTASITKKFGWAMTTTSRNLKKLIDAGLVERDSNMYRSIAVSDAYELQLAMDSGAYAADQTRRLRVERDMAVFAVDGIVRFLWNKNQKGKTL